MLENVFRPMDIGGCRIKNRFIVSPMVMNCCTEDGRATEKFIAYHEEKAKGGWGLIVTEDYAVDPSGKSYLHLPGLWEDAQIESHTELTRRVHAAGAKIFAQIYHSGRQTTSKDNGGYPVVAPSPIPCPVKKEMPHELTTEEVEAMVQKFGDAALRAKKAGFDGVQIHGAHGYLVSEFVSAYSNKRTDKYGGSLVKRLRFPLEIIADIRRKCGADFPIDYKISGEERVPGGNNIEDTKTIVRFLEDAGISSVNVSVAVYETWYMQVPPAVMDHGWLANMAADIKSVVDHIPVTTVGRVNDPLIADTIIKSGKADACYMGRASLADPHLPNKAAAGDFEDIIRCTACLQGCTGQIDAGLCGGCTLNPRTVREDEIKLEKVQKPKKVLVAGGGPAGAEAAIVAAERGHEVVLYEKKDCLGGMFALAAVPPWKGEISAFISWQSQRLDRLGARVVLGTAVTREIVEQERPDAIIIANGSLPFVPPIPGKDQPFVQLATDVLEGKVEANGRIAVIGGGLVGAETANYLATHGNDVTIIEMLDGIAKEEPDNMKRFLMKSFAEHGVEIHVSAAVQCIHEDGSITIQEKDADVTLPKFDVVLMAAGMRAVKGLDEEIRGLVPEVLYCGDSKKPGNALSGIADGYMTGLNV